MKATNLISRLSSITVKSIPDIKMNSIEVYSPFNKSKTRPSSPCISDLSPVTTLTLNLSGLSTSVAGTPFRRASWSNPVTKGSTIDDLSCNESPTFRDIFPRKHKAKHRVRKCISKIILSDSEDDKENSAPLDCCNDSPVQKSDKNMEYSSQDSGYSGISEMLNSDSPLSPLFTKEKDLFADDEDGFENIFRLEEMDGVGTLSPVPSSMSNLLMKPLLKSHKSPHHHNSKYSKLPIRRCLSMEMDSESDSSSSESTAKVEKHLASSARESFLRKVENPNTSLFKRPEPPNNYLTSYNKRRKSSASVQLTDIENFKDSFVLKRSYSETAATIMHALLKADLQPELVGDGSRSYALPLCKGRHQDLKSITAETLVNLMKGDFQSKIENFTIVDCRYPYEFEGGHIQGAKNIFTKEDIVSSFFENHINRDQKNVIVFHCEFSSERAPTLCRFLRKKDREVNEGQYPRLHHPEMYILDGGYKTFFETFKEFCIPQSYTPMNHKDHGFELRHFRAKSKSWGTDCKGRAKLRSNSKHTLI